MPTQMTAGSVFNIGIPRIREQLLGLGLESLPQIFSRQLQQCGSLGARTRPVKHQARLRPQPNATNASPSQAPSPHNTHVQTRPALSGGDGGGPYSAGGS